MEYRHGDISFHKIKEIPSGVKKLEVKDNTFNLKEGEATGHFHRLKGDFEIYQDNEGRYVLDVKNDSHLTHEEHDTIIIEKGIYIQEQEIEYCPFEKRLNQIKD